MAIVQISKIQQRSGNIVDLPQLDEAELGWATDAKQLYIGKTTPNENIEVLTSYSNISFSQITGATGNLNIDSGTVANGQVLAYDGNNWINKGGNAGGLVTLGNVSNVTMTGGAVGYVLETDGTGNLSWTPKGTITAYIQNITNANPGVVTTDGDNFYVNGAQVTITNAANMTANINGNSFYANVLTSNSFSLYTDAALTTTFDVSTANCGFFAFTSVTNTTVTTNVITVGNSAPFTANNAVKFVGTTFGGITANTTYYVRNIVSSTTFTVSSELGGSNLILTTASGTANVFESSGRAVSAVGGGGTATAAGGSNTQIQFNNGGILTANANLTFDYVANLLTVTGNANVIGNINTTGNINATGNITSSRLVSNIAIGTAPITVTSTTRVANLNVNYANVSDFEVVTLGTTGTYFPTFVSSSATGNRALTANANLSFNAATGNLITNLFTGTLTTAAQPNITSVGSLTTLAVTGNANVGNLGTAGLIVATGNITGGALSVTANANVGNLGTAGLIVATGNITGGNLVTAGLLSVTGNANVGNLGTAGLIVATGNVTGGNLVTGGLLLATGNVTGGNLVTGGALSVTANANVGNLGSGAIVATGAISGASVSVSTGTITAGTLTTGSNVTVGTITGNWALSVGSRLNATYADLAEYYSSDADYPAGTVVEFGGINEVTLACANSARVAGVVSTNPAYAMNAACPGQYPIAIALQGRVPCNVRGPILKGDMLISSGNGFAKASSNPGMGMVIGKALQNFDALEGVVEVAIGRL